MNQTQTLNATPRDLYWAAVYLRYLADLATTPEASPTVGAIIEQLAKQATANYCQAQCEADELAEQMSA